MTREYTDEEIFDALPDDSPGEHFGPRLDMAAREQRWRTLGELVADPAILDPPEPIAAPLVYAGCLSLVAAPPKKGKSTLSTRLVASVSVGGGLVLNDGVLFPEGRALVVCLDEPTKALVRRLVEFGANADRVAILPRNKVRGVADIAVAMRQFKPLLTVIDTLDKLGLREGITESGNPMPWSQLLDKLAALVHDTPAGMLVNHHLSRAGNVRDSNAIEAGADAVFTMKVRQGDDRARDFTVEARWEAEPFTLRYQEGRYYHSDLTVEREADTATARAVKLVENKPGHYSVESLARALGINAGIGRDKVKSLLMADPPLLVYSRAGRYPRLFPAPAMRAAP